MQRARVWALVGELGFHKMHSVAKKNKYSYKYSKLNLQSKEACEMF